MSIVHPQGMTTRAALVAQIRAVDDALAGLGLEPDGRGARLAGLRSSWQELKVLCNVGPEPPMRACPVCRHAGRAEATRCGYCWTTLRPVAGATAATRRFM